MARIQLGVTLQDAIVSLCDGNPGALSAMLELAKRADKIDPDSVMGPFGPLLSLDTLEIYGPNVWIVYKDLCGMSATKMTAVLRAWQLGLLSETEIKSGIENRWPEGRADEILAQVKEALPAFDAQGEPA